MNTNQDILKTKVLAIARQLISEVENNLQLLSFAEIKEAKQLLDKFENSKPAVYVFLKGGNIQGASATCEMNFELYDNDNYDSGDLDHDYRDGQTPDEWTTEINKLTSENEIKGIY